MTFKLLLREDPEGVHYFIFDQGVKDAMPPGGPHHEKVYSAPTVEELAVILGVNPKALKETIDEWNANIEKYGYDKKFGRTIQGMANMKEPPKKLDKPPYYGVRCRVCLTSMKGGLRINGKTQVLDQFGDVIPGLYAAGEIAGGLVGKPAAYYTGAMTLSAFTEGYIAGVNAAK
jgi:succinate dehydrogenase/fumarate reductase flavoprotein subunit